MSIAIAALKANEPIAVPGSEWIPTSFPYFEKLMHQYATEHPQRFPSHSLTESHGQTNNGPPTR